MKKAFCLIIYFISLNQLYSQSIKNTILFRRDKNDNSSQIIFIDSPFSIYHEKVFQILLSDTSSYSDKLKNSNSLRFIRSKKNCSKFLGDWISIYSFKGKDYAYYPSEPFFNLFIKVTDSTKVINDFNEGWIPYYIKSITNKNNEYIFKVVSIASNEFKLTFSTQNDNVFVESELFNVQKIRLTNKTNFFKLPIIVNLCPNNRCKEFDFL